GIQKWTFDGTTWMLATTFVLSGPVAGARTQTLTGRVVSGTKVALYFIAANSLATFTDDGSVSPTFSVLASAPTNTAFVGLDFAPTAQPSAAPATPLLARLPAALLFVALGCLFLWQKRARAAS